MKFTTPCFVCVENAEERKKLIEWCLLLGYERFNPSDGDCIAVSGHYGAVSSPPEYLIGEYVEEGRIDCGDDIDLFKALAAMNDENWDKQYVIDNAGNWGFCDIIPDAGHLKCRCVTMLGVAFNIDDYRKATAEEIVEHFKNSEK